MYTGEEGQKYSEGLEKLEEKVIYRLDSEGHALLIIREGISQKEVENLQKGTVELGLYIDGPIIFLLFRFGTDEWNDAPYSWHTVPRGVRSFPIDANDAANLKVGLVDAADGVVRATRVVSFTLEFADRLNSTIEAQASGSFNGLSYAKHLNIVYNQYSACDMAEMADIHMVAERL